MKLAVNFHLRIDMDVFKLSPDRRTKLEERKKELSTVHDSMFVAQIRAAKDRKQELEEEIKDVNLFIDAAVEHAHESFEKNGYDILSYPGLGKLPVGFDVYPQIMDKQAAINWLKSNDCAEIVKEDVSWQTLKSAIKERIENAKVLPDENVIHLYMKPKINFRRS